MQLVFNKQQQNFERYYMCKKKKKEKVQSVWITSAVSVTCLMTCLIQESLQRSRYF